MKSIMLHCGANEVSRDELANVVTPYGTRTHQPIDHCHLLTEVEKQLGYGGYTIEEEHLALSHEGQRFFGVLHLGSDNSDYNFMVGLRNSHDKSVVAGFAVGSRVFVCDNLAFSGQIVIARKHTRWIHRDLPSKINKGIAQLHAAQTNQDKRILEYKQTELDRDTARSMVVEMARRGAIAKANILDVVNEYESPKHDEFAPRNVWSLFNAVTEIGKKWSAETLLNRTQALHGLCDQVVTAA